MIVTPDNVIKKFDLDGPGMEKLSRIVTDPTGASHLITMEQWYWGCLDWMAATHWPESDFTRMAFEMAKETENEGVMHNPGNFPAEFSDAFRSIIWYSVHKFMGWEDDTSNDDVRADWRNSL